MVVAAYEEISAERCALANLISQRSLDASRGIVGQEFSRDSWETQSLQCLRSPERAFYAMLRDCFGVRQWCLQHAIPMAGDISDIVDRAAFELGLTEEFKTRQLQRLDPDKCVPTLLLSSNRGELLLWLKVKRLSTNLFEQRCPAMTKVLVEREESRRTRFCKSVAPLLIRSTPDTQERHRITKFRETLTASRLYEWKTFVSIITDPFNVEKLQQIDQFLEQFKRSGYRTKGGFREDMMGVLASIEQSMLRDCQKAKITIVAAAKKLLLAQGASNFQPALIEANSLQISGSLQAFAISLNQKPVAIFHGQLLIASQAKPFTMGVFPESALMGLIALSLL